MLTILVHRDGKTTQADALDPAWLDDGSGVIVWVDLAAPDARGSARSSPTTFEFHELAIEDALAEIHHPKLEAYDGYLYVILHGIDFKASEHEFATHDVDFFVGPELPGDRARRHVAVDSGDAGALRAEPPDRWREGPMALMHRIVDTMVDHYRPEVDKLEERIDELEETVFDVAETRATNQEILDLKRDVASLRRIILPQRDVLGRLARREFPQIIGGDRVPLPRRLRPRRPHLGRCAAVPRSAVGHPRGAPVERVEPPQRGDEVPDDLLVDLHADDGADRACTG